MEQFKVRLVGPSRPKKKKNDNFVDVSLCQVDQSGENTKLTPNPLPTGCTYSRFAVSFLRSQTCKTMCFMDSFPRVLITTSPTEHPSQPVQRDKRLSSLK